MLLSRHRRARYFTHAQRSTHTFEHKRNSQREYSVVKNNKCLRRIYFFTRQKVKKKKPNP